MAQLTPPIIARGLIAARFGGRTSSVHELAPDGWPASEPESSWNDPAVAEHYRAAWESFLPTVSGRGPLGYPSENGRPQPPDYGAQLKYLTFGYALALAARHKDTVSLLDWGGNLGQYGLVAEKLLPKIRIEYHCKEVPLLCLEGRRLNREATFLDDDQQFAARRFDLVMASGSLQYVRSWQIVLEMLAAATAEWLYITRLPVTTAPASLVALQRVEFADRQHSSYCWCFSRREFLRAVEESGLTLHQEFLVQETMDIAGARSSCQLRGFLFHRSSPPISS